MNEWWILGVFLGILALLLLGCFVGLAIIIRRDKR